jgi:deoxyribose-phosphate aldolase
MSLAINRSIENTSFQKRSSLGTLRGRREEEYAMELEKLLGHVDHTLLRQDATWPEIRTICQEGLDYHTASVCIPPSFVRQAAEYLGGRLPVCTVIGFPNGYATTKTKLFEAEDAIRNGASELDVVVNLGMVKEKNWDGILVELQALRGVCSGKVMKVIVETCLLTEEEKILLCQLVSASGADYIKTSTGFSTGGATREDIALFARHVAPGVKIKAAGGISSLQDAEDFLRLGADRLGTSRLVGLARG